MESASIPRPPEGILSEVRLFAEVCIHSKSVMTPRPEKGIPSPTVEQNPTAQFTCASRSVVDC